MARKIGSVKKYQRRFGLIAPRGGRISSFNKKTDYGLRLEEKQKLKFLYGLMERQFMRYVKEALKSKSNREEVLLQQLERRLDVVVFKLGFAKTLSQARQFVTHGFFKVDGKKANIPSMQLFAGDKIEMSEKLFSNVMVQESIKNSQPEPWLLRDGNKGEFLRVPSREEITVPVDVKKALELYV